MANIKTSISELHKAFHILNDRLFGSKLPEPAILIQNQGNKKNILGWCSVGEIWVDNEAQKRHEINICAEYLNRPMINVLSTLLHEMVHLHNMVNGIKDTSRELTYHNKNFKAQAENHGLTCEHDKKIGWSLTKMTQATIELVNKSGLDEKAFSLARIQEPGKEKKKSSTKKYVCPGCGAIIRASKIVNVICGDCDESFELEEGT